MGMLIQHSNYLLPLNSTGSVCAALRLRRGVRSIRGHSSQWVLFHHTRRVTARSVPEASRRRYMKTRFSHNFSENAPNGPKLHRFGNDAAIKTSKRIMGCYQIPLPWRQIIRHQVSSIVCSSDILLLFQAFLLSFLLLSHSSPQCSCIISI